MVTDHSYTIWITGVSASGKSTLGRGLSEFLTAEGVPHEWLDGEDVRRRLNHFGYSRDERSLMVAKIGELVENIIGEGGRLVIVTTISHVRRDRAAVRARLGNFFEIFLRCAPEVCAQRDTKGNYERAFRGEIDHFVGVTEPYEESLSPELEIDTSATSAAAILEQVIEALKPTVLQSGSRQ